MNTQNEDKTREIQKQRQKVLQEAYTKKKKVSIVFLIIGIIVAIIGMVVGGLNDGTVQTIGLVVMMIGILVTVISFFNMQKARKALIEVNNTVCSCGHKFRYPEDVKKTVLRTVQSTPRQGQRDTRTVIKFTCTCPKCNKTNSFNYDFLTKTEAVNALGIALKSEEYPLEDSIQKLFN